MPRIPGTGENAHCPRAHTLLAVNPNLAPRTYSGTSELPMPLVPGDFQTFPLASESTYTHYKYIYYISLQHVRPHQWNQGKYNKV